ncbi:RDD family protein [Thermithiobacillus plumbiphilus]|uniref:RDD family protein n=1 Tax=Thermithiobacillus plumbiphilus TaxID=1729899 RepID=A0ABU9D5J8_9PROT
MKDAFSPVDGMPSVAPLWRRMAAIVYDMIVLGGLFIFDTLVAHVLVGTAIQHGLAKAVFQTVLLFTAFAYFAYFWTHGGQTTGMKAWRIQLRNADASRLISLNQALLRFVVAMPAALLGGLGFLWMLFDPRRMTWHDRYSESQMFMAPWPGNTRQ